MTADEQGPNTAAIREDVAGEFLAGVVYRLCDALDAARTERDTALAEYKALVKRSTFDERTQRAERAEAERDTALAKLELPCGSCHPCMNWVDEDWRRDGRKPPYPYEYDALVAKVSAVQAAVVTARRDAWDEGYQASRVDEDGNSAWETPNPYRARASTQTPAAPAELCICSWHQGHGRCVSTCPCHWTPATDGGTDA